MISRTEVTWGEWKRVRDWAVSNGYDLTGVGDGCADIHPVHSVNWFDVLKWCNAKSEMENLTSVYSVGGLVYKSGEPDPTTIAQDISANGYRLPQEAEWEFAARGGNLTNSYTYSGSNDLGAVGWYGDNSSGAACDLWEDRGTWPVAQKAANELGLYDMSGNVWEWCWDDFSSGRHFRGGSWKNIASLFAVSLRSGNFPVYRSYNLGFRLARSAD
jgi:formylglycine-generating enzyme required for sulfatase activity